MEIAQPLRDWLGPWLDVIGQHHERWDGAGYPHRLKGTDIPFGARIVAVADSFDAMTSDRPYRRAMPVRKAVEILRAGRGTQWDPVIVDAFLRSIAGELERPAPLLLKVAEEVPEPEPIVAARA
jgi:HD-GYP domain-containing protein (c-di-GMP phosphodiesterase class II)